MDGCSEGGLRMLSEALAQLCKAPPKRTMRLPTTHDKIGYIYAAHQVVATKMAERGYQMPPVVNVDADYTKWVALQEDQHSQDAGADLEADSKTLLEGALRRVQDEIRQRAQKKESVKSKKNSQQDSDWADFSDSSFGSRSSQRSQSMKSKLKYSLRESSSRRNLRTGPSDTGTTPNGKRQKLAAGQATDDSSVSESLVRSSRSRASKKGPTRNNSQSAVRASAQTRSNVKQEGGSAKGQRAASVDKKPPFRHGQPFRAPSSDRAEFARAQNQRVQQAKERRVQQQQPEKTSNESIPSTKKPRPVKAETSATVEWKNSKDSQKKSNEVPATIPKAEKPPCREILDGEILLESSKQPVNSTFVSGVEDRPMFDATMILSRFLKVPEPTVLNTMDKSSYVPVQTDATFVKPSLSCEVGNANYEKTFVRACGDRNTKPAPHWAAVNPVDDTLLNPMDSYCNYGLEDLCSDSDNTDDEQRPRKRVPAWARMDSARFANRVAKQKALMTDISKYGHYEIVVPKYVDLEALFESSEINLNHDTSSLLWDTTQTFIN